MPVSLRSPAPRYARPGSPRAELSQSSVSLFLLRDCFLALKSHEALVKSGGHRAARAPRLLGQAVRVAIGAASFFPIVQILLLHRQVVIRHGKKAFVGGMLLRWTFAAVPLSLQLHDGLFCVLVSLLVPTHLTKCGADVQVGGCWILSRLRLQLHLQRPEEVLKRRVKLTPPLEETSHVVEGHRAEAETSGTIVLETALVVGENLCFFQKLVRLVKLSSFHQLHRERIIAAGEQCTWCDSRIS